MTPEMQSFRLGALMINLMLLADLGMLFFRRGPWTWKQLGHLTLFGAESLIVALLVGMFLCVLMRYVPNRENTLTPCLVLIFSMTWSAAAMFHRRAFELTHKPQTPVQIR